MFPEITWTNASTQYANVALGYMLRSQNFNFSISMIKNLNSGSSAHPGFQRVREAWRFFPQQ